jgi:hypothetical protein
MPAWRCSTQLRPGGGAAGREGQAFGVGRRGIRRRRAGIERAERQHRQAGELTRPEPVHPDREAQRGPRRGRHRRQHGGGIHRREVARHGDGGGLRAGQQRTELGGAVAGVQQNGAGAAAGERQQQQQHPRPVRQEQRDAVARPDPLARQPAGDAPDRGCRCRPAQAGQRRVPGAAFGGGFQKVGERAGPRHRGASWSRLSAAARPAPDRSRR